MRELRSFRTYPWSLALGLLVAGCSFDPSGGAGTGSAADGGGNVFPPDAAPDPDARVPGTDGSVPEPDAGCDELLPFTPSNFDGCDLAARNPALVLDSADDAYRIDSDAVTLTRPGGGAEPLSARVIIQDGAPELLVIATTQFTVGPTAIVGVTGSRVVAIVSTGELIVQGGISAGAVGGGSGPGGNSDASCATGRGAAGQEQDVDGTQLEAGSGGGGGAFGATGGTGAAVDDASDAELSPGGQASGTADLVPLRGGCGGGPGGYTGSGPPGGAGGGLQLVAGGALRIDGGAIVTARGGGGSGVTASLSGGGGGGSGGGLLLEATTLTIDGALTANGGGGGEGSRTGSDSGNGQNGSDVAAARAPGGGGISNGGDGGLGGGRDSEAGGGGLEGLSIISALAGGGGGGGSAGRIHLRAISGSPGFGPSAVVSPAPQ